MLGAVFAIAGFMPLIRHEAWWIRVFDFPRSQVLVLGTAVLAAFLFFWGAGRWYEVLILVGLAAALALQAVRIFPYTIIAPKEVQDARSADADPKIALLIANVLMENRSVERFRRLIEKCDPDLVLALEPDGWWEEQLRELEKSHPHVLKKPLENRYGMLLYSRLPLIDLEIRFILDPKIPSMHMRVQLAPEITVWLHCLHPEPPSPTEADESTQRDAELLIIGREVKKRDAPAIVAGDLNDVAWSYTTRLFQKISGLLDPRKGRGMFNTFNAKIPLMRWPLDHVFHSEHFRLVEMQRLPAFGSDHFAVYVCLAFEPEACEEQEGPQPDAQDQKQAQKKIEKAKS